MLELRCNLANQLYAMTFKSIDYARRPTLFIMVLAGYREGQFVVNLFQHRSMKIQKTSELMFNKGR
jgi:hypothetical protein